MTSWGETGVTIGVGAALKDQDLIFPQYREQGTIYWRGYKVEDFVNQCIGNEFDKIKGRQMPVHYCVPELSIVSISSPLGTQIPHASGAGYGFRLAKEDRIAAAYFGDGSASEGDFHTALNFA